MNWEVVIGIETHAQLSTASKIFSGAPTVFGAAPNTQASAVDLAMPGTLPVLNGGAVERAIRFGLAVGGAIASVSVFERKNYFYPDLPKGYQISQFARPIVSGGEIRFVLDGRERTVRLTRAHLEEDAGKLLHEAFHGQTGVDLNRAGTPLLEIVSEPDMRSAAEAVAYAKELLEEVRWIGICDGNMQEGSFRCDANVSVRRPGAPLGTRCEIKNLNSFRFLEKAIEYEVRRQVELLEDGGKVMQETRLFDPDKAETRSMRTKEDAQDYRYFPDPDLLPVAITQAWIEEVRRSMPPTRRERRKKYVTLGVSDYDALLLTESRKKSDFFDATVQAPVSPHLAVSAAHWINGNVASMAADADGEFSPPVEPRDVRELLELVESGTVSEKVAKDVLRFVSAGEGRPIEIIEARGLRQVSDSGALESAIDNVLAAQPRLVEDYRAGKEKAFNALVGQVMKATRGKANPQEVNRILRAKLGR